MLQYMHKEAEMLKKKMEKEIRKQISVGGYKTSDPSCHISLSSTLCLVLISKLRYKLHIRRNKETGIQRDL